MGRKSNPAIQSSHCKIPKHAAKEDYDVLEWDRERQPMNRQPASRHIEVGEVPGEGNRVMSEAHSLSWNPEDQYEQELLRGKLFTGSLSYTKEKGGGV